jgi:hypothetical protein
MHLTVSSGARGLHAWLLSGDWRAYGPIIGYDVHFFIMDTPLDQQDCAQGDHAHYLISELGMPSVESGPGSLSSP